MRSDARWDYAKWNKTMSDKEMDAAILRQVKDRAVAKRSHAALSAELTAAVNVLQTLAQALTYLNRAEISTEDPVALLNKYADLLEPSKLARLIREHADILRRVEGMDQHARA